MQRQYAFWWRLRNSLLHTHHAFWVVETVLRIAARICLASYLTIRNTALLLRRPISFFTVMGQAAGAGLTILSPGDL